VREVRRVKHTFILLKHTLLILYSSCFPLTFLLLASSFTLTLLIFFRFFFLGEGSGFASVSVALPDLVRGVCEAKRHGALLYLFFP